MGKVQIGGKTYDARDLIKSAGGAWDAANKSWTIEADKWAALVARKPLSTKGCHIIGARNTNTNTNTLCPKCGTYCYGDCEA